MKFVKYLGVTDEQVAFGSCDDPRADGLTIGAIYTVEYEDIHSYHTKISLIEYPGKRFNSVSFEEQSE